MILNANTDITSLEEIMFKDGLLIPVPFSNIEKFTQEQISIFCHKHGLYQIPTVELIDFIKSEIENEAIEIGSGNGCIGRSIGIKMTDNKMQTWPDIALTYALMRQPVVNYGTDVEEIDAINAVKKYKPNTVVACWVTHLLKEGMKVGNMHGIEEELLFENGVKKYIHVGNESVHAQKPILSKFAFKKYRFPWIVSRSMHKDLNEIYVFKV